MDEYTRAVSGQRLGKYFPVAKQQIPTDMRFDDEILGYKPHQLVKCYFLGTISVRCQTLMMKETLPKMSVNFNLLIRMITRKDFYEVHCITPLQFNRIHSCIL